MEISIFDAVDMARNKTFDEEEAVGKAMELFWEKGYEACSLQDLTTHLEIGKGSFYATFNSKEELFNRCIERYTQLSLPFLDQELLQGKKDFRKALQALLTAYVDGLLNDPKHKGCFMANSCSLVDASHVSTADQIRTHYDRIAAALSSSMQQSGIAASKAVAVSSMIITFLIGASQQSKVNHDRSSYMATVAGIMKLLH